MTIDELRYPIGKIEKIDFDENELLKKIETIKLFPFNIINLTNNLDESALNHTYRLEGWNIKQIVHHCADSHMMAFIRFKLALTEDTPTIVPYNEGLWAELKDYNLPISTSLNLISNIHERWSEILEKMDHLEFAKSYYHPEKKREVSLWDALLTYDWHCRHHIKHIEIALS